MTDQDELLNQIARCRRLARMSDDETARLLLALAADYEKRLQPSSHRAWSAA